MIKCHYCNKEYEEGSDSCPYCAGPAPYKKMMASKDKLVTDDNQGLDENKKFNVDTDKYEEETKKRLKKNNKYINKAILIFYGILILSFICIGIYMIKDFKGFRIAEKTTKKIVKAANEGNYQELLDLFIPEKLLDKILSDNNPSSEKIDFSSIDKDLNFLYLNLKKNGMCKVSKTSLKEDMIRYYSEMAGLYGGVDDTINNIKDKYMANVDRLCDIVSGYGIDTDNIYRVEAPINITYKVDYKLLAEKYNIDLSMYDNIDTPDVDNLTLNDFGIYFYLYKYEGEWYMIPVLPAYFLQTLFD